MMPNVLTTFTTGDTVQAARWTLLVAVPLDKLGQYRPDEQAQADAMHLLEQSGMRCADAARLAINGALATWADGDQDVATRCIAAAVAIYKLAAADLLRKDVEL